jgi:peptidoglycan hydrolase-like protein with peptidoglycan-binding domain
MGVPEHSSCDDTVRGIQAYHMDSNGWSDIAYNIVVCPHGYQYEGRGKGKGSAANGTTQANADWYAICALCGEGDPQGPDLVRGLQDAAATCRAWGAGDGSTGHRDHIATSCPGDSLYARVQAGEFTSGGTASGGGTTPPPSGGTTAPSFPLPSGHYFGPASGPEESHSGYYNNDDDRLRPWQQRMDARGWVITADGYYGPETESVATGFQQDKGLGVDGLIGAETWAAAWTEPVT